ncbi:B12-binding domain-containing radical SAM protein [Candidatus Woesearchaeota archaeon]|nr:B12-binding domain-containing radical SAM protein [Candidatus Woesearchaeota archaeon]
MGLDVLLAKPLVKHPIKKQGAGGDVGVPLGYLMLGGYLRAHSFHNVAIAPYRLRKAQGQERNLEEDFLQHDVICAGACTCEAPDTIAMMEVAKKLGKKRILGGIFPTFNSEELLRKDKTDFIVRGEGEQTFLELLNALEIGTPLSEVKGISYRDNGGVIHHNPDQDLIRGLDALPTPAYDLIPVKEYLPYTSGSIYGTRGCPRQCSFCTLSELWNYKYRSRSVSNIVDEARHLSSLGFKRIHFKDESITTNPKWAYELFSALEEADLDMKYKAKSRVGELDETLLEQMLKAGLDTIHFGVESITDSALVSMGKGISTQQTKEFIAMLAKNGCRANPVYMFGWPGETPESLRHNTEYILENSLMRDTVTYISFITPHPGSRIDGTLDGLQVLTKDLSRYTHKHPVAVPLSLGHNGLDLMVEQYHRVAEKTGTKEFNPRIEESYLDELKGRTTELKLRKVS